MFFKKSEEVKLLQERMEIASRKVAVEIIEKMNESIQTNFAKGENSFNITYNGYNEIAKKHIINYYKKKGFKVSFNIIGHMTIKWS